MSLIESARRFAQIAIDTNARPHLAKAVHGHFTGKEYLIPITRWDDQEMIHVVPGAIKMLAKETYEPEVTAVLNDFVPEGGIVIDAGGHFGEHALTLSHLVGPQGLVYVFEPASSVVPILRQNTKPRVADDVRSNILVKPYALNDGSSATAHITEYHPLRYSALSTISDQPRFTTEDHGLLQTTIEVPAVSLDNFLSQKGIDRVDFIKIDTENAEMGVLRGAIHTIQTFRPPVLFEGGMDKFKAEQQKTNDCVELLNEVGYTSWVILKGGGFEEFNPATNYLETINIFSFSPQRTDISI